MVLPEYFAVYDRHKYEFQILTTARDESDAITEVQPWARPPSGLIHPFTNVRWEHATEAQRQEMMPWIRGNSWFLISTKQPTEIHKKYMNHSVEIGGKLYTWWSTHHKLVWTNASILQEFQKGVFDLWGDSPAIPILEFAYRHIIPRMFYPSPVRYDVTSREAFEAILDEGCRLYSDRTYGSIDTKALRIKRPIQMECEKDEFRETDTEELDQRAPRWRHTTSSVPYADGSEYESGNEKEVVEDEDEDEDDDPQGKGRIQPVSEFCASIAILGFAGTFIGMYSFIFLSFLELGF
jgi:hypothetical protein